MIEKDRTSGANGQRLTKNEAKKKEADIGRDIQSKHKVYVCVLKSVECERCKKRQRQSERAG